eukprot:Amastigsp_a518286_7.p3 type:complete len:133 gc:universal Amastigsp_a518286_7:385-783(+)
MNACAPPIRLLFSNGRGSSRWARGGGGGGAASGVRSEPLSRGASADAPTNNGMRFSRRRTPLHTGQFGTRPALSCVCSHMCKQGQQNKWPHGVTTGLESAVSRQTLHSKRAPVRVRASDSCKGARSPVDIVK